MKPKTKDILHPVIDPDITARIGPHQREDKSVYLGTRCGGCAGEGRRRIWNSTKTSYAFKACGSCEGEGFIGTAPGTEWWSPYQLAKE